MASKWSATFRPLAANGQIASSTGEIERITWRQCIKPVVEIEHMPTSALERALVVYFRLTMAWTFLYASSHQIFDPTFTVVGFLSHTNTFHNLFAVFTTPTMAPITTVLVEYGHLLIGLSLLFGLMVRVSASAGILLMLTYWLAHMDWPFIENKNNLVIDYHLVYAGVLVLLIFKRAGHVWGMDALVENLTLFLQHPKLRAAVA
jgi:thiosulfate dehydrogenase (quinone) large subunit